MEGETLGRPTKKVAVVTPIHRELPSADEMFALKHGFTVLRDHPRIIIAPDHLSLDTYKSIIQVDEIRRFPDQCFKNIASYNRLMLSLAFYRMFEDFEYILVFQPDAFIFRDELLYWCEKGYPYIGASWPAGRLLNPYLFIGAPILSKVVPFINRPELCYVGNGGLSLRNVRASIRILLRNRLAVFFWHHQEDYFWAFYAARKGSGFPVPSEAEASKFSLELCAEQYSPLNGGALPFACHGWSRYDSWLKDHIQYLRRLEMPCSNPGEGEPRTFDH
jgi:hypothetical protein